MKKISIILLFLGITILIAGVAWIGADSILKSILSIGISGLLILTIWQVIIIFILSLAWFSVCPDLGLFRLIWARNLREAAATCLPFSQVGGLVLGIRAVCFKGYKHIKTPKNLTMIHGISSNIVDITTEIVGQVLFILLGIFILIFGGYSSKMQNTHLMGHDINLKWLIFAGAFLLFACLIPLIWSQRQGGAVFRKIIDFLSKNIAQQWNDQLLTNADTLQQHLDEIWSHPKRVGISCFIHFIGWICGGIGTWLCYHFLGSNISIVEAIAIEALVSLILSVGFLVPASIGIQEGAYVILGAIFGIDPSLSFGLSILRRARDIIIGIPVLLLWQLTELKFLRKHPQETNS